MNTEAQQAQQLLDAAFAGKLNLDGADANHVELPPEAVNAEPVVAPAEKQAAVAPEEVEGAPIAAKSGSYTIPYEKLAEARGRAKTLEEENANLRAQLDDMSAKQQANLIAAQNEAAARANAGLGQTSADQQVAIAQAAIEQGVSPDLFGDFSEEGIANGVKALVDSQVAAQVQSRVDARVNELLAPMFKQQQESATNSHYQAIYSAHPDTDSIIDSRELADWQAAQPMFVQQSIAAIFKSGTAQQVIEVFDSFKAATGKPAVSQSASVKTSVDAAIKAATDPVPTSLSSLSGGAVGVSDVERASSLAGNPEKLIEFMSTLSPEKANRLMNSIV